MTKITVDKALIEQAIELLVNGVCEFWSQYDDSAEGVIQALRTALAEVPLLSDEEIMEMVTANAGYGGTNFDRVASAVEQAVRQKAGLK